eukprot:CAMPEP_0119013640 /NCGR_PEP_ID=MMETSP1176-20130426/8652_1 /TAXON_ID=265551 /ORGANISM="Synedropsis recta cf, Strain CCMP1620" /LENGTH=136 /DNA_ID=CAMNT_0006966745 /DNA_START=56 /DNA_END=466 /DNA_ORIENTATION=-
MDVKMKNSAPELESKYARFPMKSERWRATDEVIDGQPCFIPQAYKGVKNNYIWGNRRAGKGFYHLVTRESYGILFDRLTDEIPYGGCLSCWMDDKTGKQMVDLIEVRELVLHRSKASIPDDDVAKKEAKKAAAKKK